MNITFLGDIMLSEEQISKHKLDPGKYDFNDLFKGVKEYFSDSDYIIANLETPVAGDEFKLTESHVSFNAPIELLDAIKNAGINVLTTANNHCLDRGIAGLKKTIEHIKEKNIINIGTYCEQTERHYTMLKKDELKVAVIAFTYGTNAFLNNVYLNPENDYMVDLLQKQELSNPFIRYFYQSDHLPIKALRKIARLLNLGQSRIPIFERYSSNRRELKNLEATINACRNNGADYIIACLHVGGQYNEMPLPITKYYCGYCLSKGVDAVIANHEHVIHGLKESNSKFCIYSLGNYLSTTGLISEPFDKYSEYSASVTIELDTAQSGEIKSKYFIRFFKNELDDNGKVFSIPLFDLIQKEKKEKRKNKLFEINNLLVNRIAGTKHVSYPLCPKYEVNSYGRIKNTKN